MVSPKTPSSSPDHLPRVAMSNPAPSLSHAARRRRTVRHLLSRILAPCLLLSLLVAVGCDEDHPPKFNRVQFAIRTGKFELARSASATATLKSRDGKVLKQIVLKPAHQAPWRTGTTHYGVFGLKEPLDYCSVGSVEIQFQPPSLPSSGGTSWTLQNISVNLSIDNVNQTTLVNQVGSQRPAAELTSQQPLFTSNVACTRQSTLFARLGGKKSIDEVAEDFTRRLQEDKRLAPNFARIASDDDRRRDLQRRVAHKMCHLSGGPCEANAETDASPLLDVIKTPADYRAMLDDLMAAMGKFPASTSPQDKNQLLGTRVFTVGKVAVVALGGSQAQKTVLDARMTGANSGAIGSPLFVNLYWDSNWDSDNSGLGLVAESVDGAVQAATGSSYFSGLSEYSVTSASFIGSFLPHPSCTQQPGATVGFYDPVNPSLLGLLNCQLQNEDAVPQGDNVIYNIIMPKGTTEADSLEMLFGAPAQCSVPGSPAAWHFHGSPYSITSDIGGILGGALGGLVGWFISPYLTGPGAALGAVAGFLVAMDMEGAPFWTISSTSTSCGNFTHNLLHEMVEASVDATPPLNVVFTGNGEIVDFCDDKNVTPSSSWVPTSSLPSGVTLAPGTFASLQVPQYWTNSGQACIPGFTVTTTPAAPSVSMSGTFPVATITITGSGFGSGPGAFVVPTSTPMPYLGIQDSSQNWQAGNSLNADPLGFTITSWADNSITIGGFSPPSGSNFAMQNGDNLVVWVCNPASGFCTSTTATATISGSGQNPNDITSLGITITTGNDNARADSELWITIEGQTSQCLKPSNNAGSDSVCTNGGSARDQNGRQEWTNGSSDPAPQVFSVAMPAPIFSSLSIKLISHNSFLETDDNWDIQAITITGTTRGGSTSTLFTQTNPMPPNDNNCIARLKGSPNATTVRIPLNGVGVPTYVDGKPGEAGVATSCKNNGDQ